MVGDSYASTQRRGPEFYNAPTQPATMDQLSGRPVVQAPVPPSHGGRVEDFVPAATPAGKIVKTVTAAARSASIAPIRLDLTPAEDFGKAFSANSPEVTHDPDLDEAVIAFANADFEQCEQSLSSSVRA